jgi:transcriptional regulator of nitric oxide reductase
MLEGLTINRHAFERTVRLVTTARLRQSAMLDLVDESELEALSEIEGATSNRRIAQARGAGEVQSYELVYGVPHAHFIKRRSPMPSPGNRTASTARTAGPGMRGSRSKPVWRR